MLEQTEKKVLKSCLGSLYLSTLWAMGVTRIGLLLLLSQSGVFLLLGFSWGLWFARWDLFLFIVRGVHKSLIFF